MYFQSYKMLWKHGGKHMLVESMVRKTLGIKSHVVKSVAEDDEGLLVSLDIRQ